MEPRNLVLILARDLADKLATAVFLVDQEGSLVYFNERAGEILGQKYSSAGRMTMEEWTRAFPPVDEEGNPAGTDDLPLVVALRTHRPAHKALRIRAGDGEMRDIAVTALPFFARKNEFVGAAAVFWEHPPKVPEGVG